jgi:hypothetical protein
LRMAIAVRHAPLSASQPAPAPYSRRKFLAEFARAAAVATAATALSALSSTSFAGCDCSRCRSDQYCCPTTSGNCGCFPMPCP